VRGAGQVERSTAVGGRGRKVMCVILLVEDEPAVREFLAQALEQNGHRVLRAINGHQALNVVSGAGFETPDLIISDVTMPMIGGLELCREIKRNPASAGIPVILMSAAAQPSNVGTLADAFILKPFDLDALDVLIESHALRRS
jgi:two-component system, OmpR family, phosphate regulon response regulator PhoB